MKLSEFLQGKWLGHSLHAAVVHVPVGGWLVACVLDLSIYWGWTEGGEGRLASIFVGVGLLGALIAIPPGIADWLEIKPGKPARKLGVYHMLLNVAATAAWGVNFALRLATERPVTPAILITSLAGTLLVLASAYLGSLLVFDHGIGVARFSKKEWRKRAIRDGSRVPEES